LLSVAALALAFGTNSALATTYTIDQEHSSVTFRVSHLVSKVTGKFKTFSGTIDYDGKAPAKSKVALAIETASIDTSNVKRDEHLKSADFFDAAKNPKITFESKEFNGKQLKGVLNMHGVSKDIVADVEVGGETVFMGTPKAGFTGKAKINRKDFGIVWNKALDSGGFVLGEEVEITIEIEATGPAAAPAKKK
jgi:polyisoprenoid-binding protein YceI